MFSMNEDIPQACQGKKAAVLLASYNGEAYLEEQLESLLKQTVPIEQILIRDDQSSDATPEIIRSYQEKYENQIKALDGGNLGFVGNFLRLVESVSPEFDYYFFCDQDDVWYPEKIERAMTTMERFADATTPQIYFCRLDIVDEDLQPLGQSPLIRHWGLGNALFENPMTGCTIAFNAAFLHLLQANLPQAHRVVAHDWWCYLVATALAQIHYDERPGIAYRQHQNNSLGAKASMWSRWKQRMKDFFNGKWHRRRPEPMVSHFAELYRDKLSAQQHFLIATASRREKGRVTAGLLWAKKMVWRRKWSDHLILLLLLLFWKPRSQA